MDKETINGVTEATAKRAIKDSVFRNLFMDKKYLIQLYHCLHPEDSEITMDDLTYITLENILINDIYNDLGFLVGNKLLILVEAQSTWTENIIVRSFMYLGRTFQDYLKKSGQYVYGKAKIQVPVPELYVVYTGTDKIDKNVISLSEEFFGGQVSDLDVRVHVITNGREGDILNQYVVFSQIINDQIRIYGRTRAAVEEAIKICKRQNVLKEYLADRETEVVDIMMTLYSQEQAIDDYVASRERETSIRITVECYKDCGFGIEEIANKIAQKFTIPLDWATKKAQMYW